MDRDSLRQRKYGVWVIPLVPQGSSYWSIGATLAFLKGKSWVLRVVGRNEEHSVDGMGVLGKEQCSLVLWSVNIQLGERWWPLGDEARACCFFYHDEGSLSVQMVPLGAVRRQVDCVKFGVMFEGQALRRAA